MRWYIAKRNNVGVIGCRSVKCTDKDFTHTVEIGCSESLILAFQHSLGIFYLFYSESSHKTVAPTDL